jgi:hypothetical protein
MNLSTARLTAVVALASGISCGTALADAMTGSLVFPGDPSNSYDGGGAGFGFVPSIYDNANGPTVMLVGGVATFGYDDGANTITAAFTAGKLEIQDIVQPGDPNAIPAVLPGSVGWMQTFTASTQGFFTGWSLTSDMFSPHLTSWSLDSTDTTLTVTWGGTGAPGTYDAVFSSSPVPGPIVGAGLPGLAFAFGGMLAWRRRKRAMA